MIILTADHAGYDLKEKLKKHLTKKGVDFVDNGAHTKDEFDDYPDFVKSASELVLENQNNKGIFLCGSGIGIAIAANKIKGIRAAVAYNAKVAKLAGSHNNANVITLGGRFFSFLKAKKIVDAYLSAQFEGGRHKERIEKIKNLEC